MSLERFLVARSDVGMLECARLVWIFLLHLQKTLAYLCAYRQERSMISLGGIETGGRRCARRPGVVNLASKNCRVRGTRKRHHTSLLIVDNATSSTWKLIKILRRNICEE